MIEQQSYINLIFGGIPQVVHVSQYDVGRVLSFTLFKGSEQYIFSSGETAIVNGRKPDGTVFTYGATITNNVVYFTTTMQMLAVSGNIIAEIRIQGQNGEDIGTVNFVIAVEKAPINEDAVYSESDLPVIEEAIYSAGVARAAAQQALGYKNDAQTSASNAANSASSASTSATNAAASATSAGTSATNASNSAEAAAISEANAFSGTPEGYAELAATFNALGLYVDSSGYTCQALFGETKD
jgi:hypothetical protein